MIRHTFKNQSLHFMRRDFPIDLMYPLAHDCVKVSIVPYHPEHILHPIQQSSDSWTYQRNSPHRELRPVQRNESVCIFKS